MQIFTRVVETNSFSRAASAVHLPRASVTRIIQELEAHLKVRLLNRSTRSLNLTEQGSTYYEHCVRVLADISAAEESLSTTSHAPRGKIRVDMPGFISKHIVLPDIQNFRMKYPDIEIVVGISDRYVDLIQEGVDCAIRIGDLNDSTLVARGIGVSPLVMTASRDYLCKNGKINSISDLSQHEILGFVSSRTGRVLHPKFISNGRDINIKANVSLATNEGDAYLHFALLGLGLVQIPKIMAQPYLDKGDLVEVLADHRPTPPPISLLYPKNRHLSPQIRAFLDWTIQRFEQCEPVRPSSSRAHPSVECVQP
ncbi:LysR family transcriptional regulator [Cupriavidus pauculus]|uniref:LysR family transcriptional regulator n=1 Tax=Cupriavidus pauculus TaxID=82633 RepID=UPI001FD3D03E|nr:LysR family transcriptional regulator [Cupriavidus pauculus]